MKHLIWIVPGMLEQSRAHKLLFFYNILSIIATKYINFTNFVQNMLLDFTIKPNHCVTMVGLS